MLNSPHAEHWHQIRTDEIRHRKQQERDLIRGAAVIFVCLIAALWAVF